MLRRIIGGLLLVESIFMIIPFITCIYYHENDWSAFLFTIIVTAVAGFGMAYKKPTSSHIGKREGYLLTASVWVFFSLFGLIPFMLCSKSLDFSSAFFEAMSSFTTTGATTIDATIGLPGFGIRMWQALMQWLGGMGIILFTLAILPTLNSSGGVQMFNAEVTGITHDKIMPRISQTAMALWGTYIALTLLMIIILWVGPMSLFDSICHAFGTLSTGGFSSRAGSISEFESDYVLVVVTLFMFMGGLNLANLIRIATRKWHIVKRDEVVRIYIGAILVFAIMIAIAHYFETESLNWRDLTIRPLFQVVSTITSTGYIAPGFGLLCPFVLALTLIMMFSGACAGSTSGGAKIDRIIVLKKYLKNEIFLATHPIDICSVRINGHVVNPDLVRKVVAFLCLYIISVCVGGTLLSMLEMPIGDSFFLSLSCISNTGFGASVAGCGADYLTIPAASKWVLSALMLIGRLEIYTVLVLIMPGFWKH